MLLFLSAVILSGCSNVQRTTPAPNLTFKNVESAAFEINSISELKYDTFQNIIINKNLSPKINIQSRFDYFEVIDVTGKAGSEFNFVSYGICDCIGFKKQAVLADLYLIDPDGEVVDLQESGDLQVRTINGSFEKTGGYKLIIVANSEFIGSEMGKISGTHQYSGLSMNLNLPLIIHPTGTVQIRWAK